MLDYSIKSWDSFCFCVTPEELCRVLEGLHLVRYSGSVAENYRETPVGEYAALYEKLLEYLKTDCREQFRVVSRTASICSGNCQTENMRMCRRTGKQLAGSRGP